MSGIGPARSLVLAASMFAVTLSTAAEAGWVRYDRVIACAAWHVFAAGELTAADKQANKKQIKQHMHDAGLLMDLATGLMDRPGMTRAQVVADTRQRFGELVDAYRSGTSQAEIDAGGQAVCHHLGDED